MEIFENLTLDVIHTRLKENNGHLSENSRFNNHAGQTALLKAVNDAIQAYGENVNLLGAICMSQVPSTKISKDTLDLLIHIANNNTLLAPAPAEEEPTA